MLRVVKFRGSFHSTDEYPFIITENGISVMPVTSLGLSHDASLERVSSGNPALDGLLGGQGFFRGSTVLVSGTSGTGKTSIAASLIPRHGQRAPGRLVEGARAGRGGGAPLLRRSYGVTRPK